MLTICSFVCVCSGPITVDTPFVIQTNVTNNITLSGDFDRDAEVIFMICIDPPPDSDFEFVPSFFHLCLYQMLKPLFFPILFFKDGHTKMTPAFHPQGQRRARLYRLYLPPRRAVVLLLHRPLLHLLPQPLPIRAVRPEYSSAAGLFSISFCFRLVASTFSLFFRVEHVHNFFRWVHCIAFLDVSFSLLPCRFFTEYEPPCQNPSNEIIISSS